jgi:tRNA pseudouridine38-40 synthase
VNRSIKTELISKALNILEGENDFRHFTTPNAIGKTSKRNIMRTSLTEDNSFIYISITANGFLRYMVRSIIGTIIQLSQEKTTIDHFESSLSGEKSDPLPITLKAKPHGLYLVKVYYNENPFKEGIELQNGILNWQFLKESKIWEY